MLFLLSICLCQTLHAEINYAMKMFSKYALVNVIIIISVNPCCCFLDRYLNIGISCIELYAVGADGCLTKFLSISCI